MLNNHGDKRGLPHQQVTRNCLGYDQGIKLVHKIHMDCVLGLLFRGLLCNDRPFPPAEKLQAPTVFLWRTQKRDWNRKWILMPVLPYNNGFHGRRITGGVRYTWKCLLYGIKIPAGYQDQKGVGSLHRYYIQRGTSYLNYLTVSRKYYCLQPYSP